ncbi:uncharacterized protein BDW47DRAFT_99370 [Aspergillus candidus]|uniref:Uncharacterized protein n=1 Tax=Aspergillus candidus TaxID=41067 RepID=A0A2I2FLW5_ASPCN|nr:hypothetical protein BDW47DRAFT_99370 [Aspergillus candidus]PLB41600.1 hypothetical protein BDW47DRAFT_99370 [Aspergillus candidus]
MVVRAEPDRPQGCDWVMRRLSICGCCTLNWLITQWSARKEIPRSTSLTLYTRGHVAERLGDMGRGSGNRIVQSTLVLLTHCLTLYASVPLEELGHVHGGQKRTK